MISAICRPPQLTAHRDVCRFPAPHCLPSLSQFQTPIAHSKQGRSANLRPTRHISGNQQDQPSALHRFAPLSRQHRDKPSNNSRFISPTPLQRDKPSRNSRICLAETLPVKQNKSATPIPSHTAVFTETNQVAAPDLSHHYRYLQIPRQHGDRRGKRLPRKRG